MIKTETPVRIYKVAMDHFEKWNHFGDWPQTDSPLKYVDPYRAFSETVRKCWLLTEFILSRWGGISSVDELGPGACYLGVMLSDAGVSWRGFDRPDREMYDSMADDFGLDVISELISHKSFFCADLIVATQISFLNEWSEDQFVYWLNLNKESMMLLFPNPQALGGDVHDILPKYAVEIIELDILGTGYLFGKGV